MSIKRLRRFKVWPGKDKKTGPFFWVSIYPTKKGMYRHVDSMGYDTPHEYEAICLSYSSTIVEEDGSTTVTKCIGELVFYFDSLGSGIVSHECCHGAFRYLEHIGNPYVTPNEEECLKTGGIAVDSPEEIYCLAQGFMVNQFWTYYYDNIEK